MADGLTKKKRVRGAHKASATKIMQQIAELVEKDTPDQTKLACLRQALNEKLTTIKALDNEVIELLEDDAVVEDIEGADIFKEKIFTSLLLIDQLMETLKTTNPAHTTPTVNHSRVKLPKLQLHPFSGDLIQWTSFWDSYESAIHTNEQ